MAVFGNWSATSRRAVAAVGLAAALGGVAVSAQAPAAPAPAPAAPAQAPAAPPAEQDAFKFATDAAFIIWLIKPEATADFEAVWTAIRAKLTAATNPQHKALGDSLKVFKGDGPPSPEGATYFFTIDPASKDLSYNPRDLLYTYGLFERAEADPLYAKLAGSINQIRPVGMTKVP